MRIVLCDIDGMKGTYAGNRLKDPDIDHRRAEYQCLDGLKGVAYPNNILCIFMRTRWSK